MFKLFYLNRDNKLFRTDLLDDGSYTFGRGQDCYYRFDNNYVSRHHFEITISGDQLTVRDLGSLSGTHCNFEKIDGHKDLVDQGVLAFGFQSKGQPSYTILVVREGVSVDHLLQVYVRDYPIVVPDRFKPLIPSSMEGPTDYTTEETDRDGRLGLAKDKFEIVDHIKNGGTASVFRVIEKETNRELALKMLLKEAASNEFMFNRFAIEARFTQFLSHPNIIPVYHVGYTHHRNLYFTMPCIDGSGGTYHQRFRQGTREYQLQGCRILAQVARGLAFAHSQRLVHLDIKPGNILVTSEGHPYIIDWGLVRFLDSAPQDEFFSDSTSSGVSGTWDLSSRPPGTGTELDLMVTIAGAAADRAGIRPATVSFQHPRYARFEPLEWRFDLWPLCLMLFKTLTGLHPYEQFRKEPGTPLQAYADIYRDLQGEHLASISDSIDDFKKISEVCDRGLEKNDFKYDSMTDFADDLSNAIELEARRGIIIEGLGDIQSTILRLEQGINDKKREEPSVTVTNKILEDIVTKLDTVEISAVDSVNEGLGDIHSKISRIEQGINDGKEVKGSLIIINDSLKNMSDRLETITSTVGLLSKSLASIDSHPREESIPPTPRTNSMMRSLRNLSFFPWIRFGILLVVVGVLFSRDTYPVKHEPNTTSMQGLSKTSTAISKSIPPQRNERKGFEGEKKKVDAEITPFGGETPKSSKTKLKNDYRPKSIAFAAGLAKLGCQIPPDRKKDCDEGEEKTSVFIKNLQANESEATVEMYSKCVEMNACSIIPTDNDSCNFGSERLQHPINCITRKEARQYCKWIGMRLPSKEEWEFLARGEGARIFPWGNASWKNSERARGNASGKRDGFLKTSPVRSFAFGKSPGGLYDLAGNVSEWTSSGGNEDAVIKGGNYRTQIWNLRAAEFEVFPADTRLPTIGVRCVKEIQTIFE